MIFKIIWGIVLMLLKLLAVIPLFIFWVLSWVVTLLIAPFIFIGVAIAEIHKRGK